MRLLNLFSESIHTLGTASSGLLGVPGGPAESLSAGWPGVHCTSSLPVQWDEDAPSNHGTDALQSTHVALHVNASVLTLLHQQESGEHACWLSFLW